MICVLIGPPGAGKGTLSSILVSKYGFESFSTGDALREEVKKGTELGKEIDSLIRNGSLVSDELVTQLVKNKLEACKSNILFDGYPRNLEQGKLFDQLLLETDKKIDHIIHMYAEDATVISRLCGRMICSSCSAIYNTLSRKPVKEGICDKCGKELIKRSDDTEEAIRKRLNIYAETTRPLLDFYRPRGIVFDIDSNKEIDESLRELLNHLKVK